MFGPRSFDYSVEPQLTSVDAFCSVILWVYSSNSLFSASEAGSGQPFSVYVTVNVIISAIIHMFWLLCIISSQIG